MFAFVPVIKSCITGIEQEYLENNGVDFPTAWKAFTEWTKIKRVSDSNSNLIPDSASDVLNSDALEINRESLKSHHESQENLDLVHGNIEEQRICPVVLLAHNGKNFDFKFLEAELNRLHSPGDRETPLHSYSKSESVPSKTAKVIHLHL